MSERPSGFGAASLVSTYAEQAPQTVPGYHDIHTMASVLLAEEAPADAQVLVLGAGGGLEIKAFATAHPQWKFMAVDPSTPMIDLAKDTLGPLAARMDVHEGYVDDAPEGPFGAATGAAATSLDRTGGSTTHRHRGAPLATAWRTVSGHARQLSTRIRCRTSTVA